MKLANYIEEVSKGFIDWRHNNLQSWNFLVEHSKAICVNDWRVSMGYTLIKHIFGVSIITDRMYAEGANDTHVANLLRHCIRLAEDAD